MTTETLLPSGSAPSIFASFRSFWGEIEAARAMALAGAAAAAPGDVTPGATGELTHGATAIRARLLAVLKAQEAASARVAHGASLQAWRDAQFLMAALADDVFVRLDWKGAGWWLWNPLETALYGTRSAGARVFERIDQLTAAGEPAQRELAAVYLAALAVGFEGQYAGAADRSPLDDCRRRLRTFVFGDREPLQGPLVAQCYAHTDVSGRGPLLRSARVWWWAALVVLAAWLAASSVAWRRATEPIAESAARVDAVLETPAGGAR